MLLNTNAIRNVTRNFEKDGHSKGSVALPFKVDGKVVFFE